MITAFNNVYRFILGISRGTRTSMSKEFVQYNIDPFPVTKSCVYFRERLNYNANSLDKDGFYLGASSIGEAKLIF